MSIGSLLTKPGTRATKDVSFFQDFTDVFSVVRNGGTITGTPTFQNRGVALDTTSKVITYTWQKPVPSVFFIEAKVNISFTSGTYQTLFCLGVSGNYSFEVGIDNTASTTAKKMYYKNSTTTYVSTTTFSSGAHTLTWVYDTTNITFYVDGVILGTAVTANAPTVNTSVQLNIGRLDTSSQTANATIYSILAGSTTITATGVLYHFNNSFLRTSEGLQSAHLFRVQDYDLPGVKSNDLSGKNNNFTLGNGSTSTTYPTKLSKRGFSFDGSSDYGTIGTFANFNPSAYTNLSVFVWFNLSSFVANGVLLDQRDSGPNNGWQILQSGTTNLVNVGILATSSQKQCTAFSITYGMWYFLGFTYTSQNLRMYVNGKFTSANTTGTTIMTPCTSAQVTAMRRSSTYTTGSLGGVFIYNDFLNDERVFELFQKTRSNFNLL